MEIKRLARPYINNIPTEFVIYIISNQACNSQTVFRFHVEVVGVENKEIYTSYEVIFYPENYEDY